MSGSTTAAYQLIIFFFFFSSLFDWHLSVWMGESGSVSYRLGMRPWSLWPTQPSGCCHACCCLFGGPGSFFVALPLGHLRHFNFMLVLQAGTTC